MPHREPKCESWSSERKSIWSLHWQQYHAFNLNQSIIPCILPGSIQLCYVVLRGREHKTYSAAPDFNHFESRRGIGILFLFPLGHSDLTLLKDMGF